MASTSFRWVRLVVLLFSLSLLAACMGESPEAPPAATATAVANADPDNADDTDDSNDTDPDPAVDDPTAVPPPVPTRPAAAPDDQTWLIMVYSDADDEILEEDMFNDLNEAEMVGSTDRVTVVAQMDRFEGGFDGDGDWTSTKRFLVQQDADLEHLASQELADLGEVNMADGATLVDFMTWAITTYPADKYVLIMSDHGAGWPGGWGDPAPEVPAPADVALGESFGDMLYLMEMQDALAQAISQTGIGQLELIGFDACLMSHIEVYAALAPYARYAVASQEVEPSLGWAYAAFLARLADSPEIDGAELSRAIVDSYIDQDQQILDDDARAKYVARNYEYGDDTSAEAIAAEENKGVTLVGVDLQQFAPLMSALDDLTVALSAIDPAQVAAARSRSQNFQSVFDESEPSPYIDLGSFVLLLKESSPETAPAGDAVLAAVTNMIVAERHGDNLGGATGISIHFPNSTLFEAADSGLDSYRQVASTFAAQSQWDEYLAAYYGGAPASGTDPQAPAAQAPGASVIEVGEIEASDTTVSADNPVTFATTITGDNVAFIYSFVGYVDEESGAVFVVDMDYVEADTTLEQGGVSFPDWSGGTVDLEFEWDGSGYTLNDGATAELALFEPQDYGDDESFARYTVSGIYTSAAGQERRAILIFSDGAMVEALAYASADDSGALSAFAPQPGDQFTILNRWLTPQDDGSVELEEEPGATITFGGQNLTWDTTAMEAGEYIFGFIVEDFDGNRYEAYTQVTVE